MSWADLRCSCDLSPTCETIESARHPPPSLHINDTGARRISIIHLASQASALGWADHYGLRGPSTRCQIIRSARRLLHSGRPSVATLQSFSGTEYLTELRLPEERIRSTSCYDSGSSLSFGQQVQTTASHRSSPNVATVQGFGLLTVSRVLEKEMGGLSIFIV